MEKFFNKRDRKISNLNLMADSLGYSLRENVSLFSVDDHSSFVTFVTESGNIIANEANCFQYRAPFFNLDVKSVNVQSYHSIFL